MSSFVCVQHGDSTPDDIDSAFTVIKSGEQTICGNDDSVKRVFKEMNRKNGF